MTTSSVFWIVEVESFVMSLRGSVAGCCYTFVLDGAGEHSLDLLSYLSLMRERAFKLD